MKKLVSNDFFSGLGPSQFVPLIKNNWRYTAMEQNETKMSNLNLIDFPLFSSVINDVERGPRAADIILSIILDKEVKVRNLNVGKISMPSDSDRGVFMEACVEEKKTGRILDRAVFITSFDPYNEGKMLYTLKKCGAGNLSEDSDDQAATLYFYIHGNGDDQPQELRELAAYIADTTPEKAVNAGLREL